MTVFCKDCQFHNRGYCHAPQLNDNSNSYLVTGEQATQSCVVVRCLECECGKQGRWFVQCPPESRKRTFWEVIFGKPV